MAEGPGSGWPLPGPAAVLTAFGERYLNADGSTATHRGIDLAAEPGSAVSAVIAGTVTFAGRVPAGEGATTVAVTVENDDVRITYLPLSEALVSAGDNVDATSTLGILAAAGDRSHPETHLHIGVRRDTLYIDPVPFLAFPVAAPVDAEPEPTPAAAAAAPAAVPAVAPAADPVPSTAGARSTSSVHVSSPEPAATAARTSAHLEVATTPGAVPVLGTAGGAVVTGAPSTDGGAVRASTNAAPDVPDAGGVGAGASAGILGTRTLGELPAVPEQLRAGLAVDRRADVLKRMPLSAGIALFAVAALAVAFLWPVWKTVPPVGLAVGHERSDVAAVVAR